MKLIILRSNLKEGLDGVTRVASDSSTTLPILKNFLIETVDNRIKLSATNLELAVTHFVSAKVVEGGSITVPANIFNSIIGNLQSERINLETEGNNLIIKTDNYKAKIQGIKREEFPIIPKVSQGRASFEVNKVIFRNTLAFVVGAAQLSDLRPELNGVLLDYGANVLKLAATDSFRLAEKKLADKQFQTDIEGGFRTIIPLRTVNEVIKLFKSEDGGLSIWFDGGQVLFKDDNVEIVSRLVNGEFPDYEPIIPEQVGTEALIDKNELINALKLTSSFTDRLNEVKILIQDKTKNIEVSSSAQGLGENHYLIPAKTKGVPVQVVFNWRFLLDGLKGFDSQSVSMGFNGSEKPSIIKAPGETSSFYILMPIKAG